ncbi:S8 family serine peptidase [Spirosoma luteum]|uniref:S8 family serine peptidase n=1 Tax=Spirosoma luteum TaxID=431553 RepID=UPI00036AC2FB|nr:S8 family serine peptidase [Spirosoma luteum]
MLWQKEIINRYSQLRKETIRLAKQHTWELRKNYSNQRILQLQGVDAFGQPIYYTLHNVEAARGTRTLALQDGGAIPINVSGSLPGMAGRLGLWDGGRVLESHQEFGNAAGKSRVRQKDSGASVNNHATHLAGTLIGRGVNEQARGMANEAQLSVWDYTNDLAELAVAAPNLLVSNHAYGPVTGWVYNASRPGTNPDLKWEWWGNTAISTTDDYLFGFYNTTVQDLDRLGYNNPFFLMVRSADNKRTETGPPAGSPYFLKDSAVKSTIVRNRNADYDVIPADATAKNVLTVGAAEVNFTSQNQPVLIGSTAYSGWGPTDDGRIKPDLLGIGSDVISSVATDDVAYGTYSGTSMASANVSGSLFLLQELYARQRAAGLPQNGQFMRAATLKGLVLHTADRPNPAAGPDYRQGWGLLNTEAAARLLLNENQAHLVLEQSLAAGKTISRSVIAQGNEPLVITLSWTDPEGIPTPVGTGALNNRTPKLVNDLDVRLSDGVRTTFPFSLNPAYPDRAAGQTDNFRDNVEQIYLTNPVPGKTYTLTVSHKGTMQYASQPFSLIISGQKRVNCQLAVSIQPAKDTVICNGTVLPLQASTTSGNLSYQWLRDGVIDVATTASVYQATKAGTYILRITNKNGCSATSQPVHVKTAAVDLNPLGNQWLCNPDESVQLKAIPVNGVTMPGATFSWLLNNTVIPHAADSTFRVTQPGRYRVRVVYKACQVLSDEKTVLASSVNNLDLVPAGAEFRLPPGATLTLKVPQDTSYQYQWYRNNDLLPNARTYSLLVSQAGTYRVRVTQHACVGYSTDRTILTTVLTATVPDPTGHFGIYPNPAETMLYVRYANPTAKQVHLQVVDLQGRAWNTPVSLNNQLGETHGAITIQYLPPGVYILQLSEGDKTQTERFLKN